MTNNIRLAKLRNLLLYAWYLAWVGIPFLVSGIVIAIIGVYFLTGGI